MKLVFFQKKIYQTGKRLIGILDGFSYVFPGDFFKWNISSEFIVYSPPSISNFVGLPPVPITKYFDVNFFFSPFPKTASTVFWSIKEANACI